ncbi:SPOR domain-containing protein [Kitasatospora sp. NPDC004240]
MGTFRVMRQDDNGNRFEVSGGLGREEAEALAAEFEARGHKQLYWVEADGRPADGP